MHPSRSTEVHFYVTRCQCQRINDISPVNSTRPLSRRSEGGLAVEHRVQHIAKLGCLCVIHRHDQAATALESLVATAYKEAKNGFTVPGLGKLVVVDRKARIGRNPATGEQIKIKAKKVLKFRVAKAAKDACLGAKK